jgi:hypothetical protein
MRLAGHGKLMSVGRGGLGRMNIRSPNMTKRMQRCELQKQAHWEEVLRRWQESGKSVRAYCRAEGLRESAFYFWRRELERRSTRSGVVSQARPKASSLARASRSAKRQSPPPTRFAGAPGMASFLPVRVVENAAPEATGGVEVVLAHGRTIRVQSGFCRQTLADVLAVLEVRPC